MYICHVFQIISSSIFIIQLEDLIWHLNSSVEVRSLFTRDIVSLHFISGPPLTQKLSGGGDTPPDLPLSPPPPIGFTGQDVVETEQSVSVVNCNKCECGACTFKLLVLFCFT